MDTDKKRELVCVYWRKLISGKKICYDGLGGEAYKEQDSLTIIRYVLEEVFGMSAEEAHGQLDEDSARRAGLAPFIDCLPRPANGPIDYDLIVARAYGEPYDYHDQTKRYAERISDPDDPMVRYPQRYFDGPQGLEEAWLMLIDRIMEYLPSDITDDILALYRLFADKERAHRLLTEWGIADICKRLYGNDALLYLHSALPEEYANTLYYNVVRGKL